MTALLHDLAASRPDGPAIVDDRGTVTWSELDERVNRLIHALRTRGLTEGDSIALMAGNQREQFEVSLAAMQAGWLVVPVNWHLVADELAYIVDDAGARALVVDDRWLDVGVEAASRSAGGRPHRGLGPASQGVRALRGDPRRRVRGRADRPGQGRPDVLHERHHRLPEGGSGSADEHRRPGRSGQLIGAGFAEQIGGTG